MEEIPIDMVRRLIDQMKRKAHPEDAPAQRLIRKYERLLREAIREQRRRNS